MRPEMDQPRRPLKKICIVGGGTAGWIAAALMAEHFKGRMAQVELVESDDIGTIGVGESTVPPFLEMLKKLGINEQDFIQQTQASFKLGIQFDDWTEKGESYFHPFGAIGVPVDVSDFYPVWLKARMNGYRRPLMDFASAAQMAAHERFMLPFKAQRSPIGGASYAVHVDAKRVARYLRDFAEARGVKRTEGIVEDVMTRPDGFVSGLKLKSGQTVEADFFIDCTGFRALLIGKTLGVGYTDWSEWLMCDRAIAVQTENVGAPKPYTLAQAQDCGWRWRIPLQHRTGNGHVFCSRYMSDDEATARLLAQVEGRPVVNPMVVPFKTGVRQKIWDRNVLSLGLASGFIEPLESTAIHLIYRGMDFFFRLMPDLDCDPELAAEYNRRMTVDYEEIRDFIILHYALTRRDDTPFWRECRDMVLPEGLQHKLDVFRANGSLVEALDPLFRNVSWYAVMDGMGVTPRSYPPLVDRIDFTGLTAEMDRAADILNAFVKDLPSHQQFLQDNCPAPPVDLAPVAPAAVPA